MHEKETTMKPRTLISVFALAVAASSSACSAETQQASSEPTATTEQAQIATLGNIMAWPAGPITWTGLTGTWPINVWSPAAIGALAFDIAGVTNLGITVAGFPAMLPLTITTPWLNAFVPPVAAGALPGAWGAPFFGGAGLYAPAFGYTGAYAPYAGLGYGFGAYAPFGALQGTWLNGGLTAGWGLWAPTLTSSALMFNNLAVLNTFTPFTFNLTFTAQAAAQTAAITSAAAFSTAALSVFATPITATTLAAQTAAIPFMSIAFPIMPLPLAATTPFLTAPLATTAAFF
jgi:hypothetical protein